jgi:hypothetical protein
LTCFIQAIGFTPMASAQQITGVPGSPSATTTIPGEQLPPPAPKFGGVITENRPGSTPWWPPTVVPPKDAPNVLLKLAGLDGTVPGIRMNPDGGVTIWFGPKAPAGQEKNWVQTMPGTGYNVALRLYGPLEPWFNQTWRPGDIELAK